MNTKWKQKFLTITLGQTISLIGSSAVQFSIIWWLASKSSSPAVLAFSGLVAFLPQLILGPFAGVWIDRLNRKWVVIGADMFMGLIAVVFAVVFWQMKEPPFWSACLVLGVRAVGDVFHTPAIQAIIPTLVPKEELMRANGWSQFMKSGAFMLGPVFGALLYSALPMHLILITDFIGALAASLTMFCVHVPDIERTFDEKTNFLHELKEGGKIYLQDKKLLLIIAASTLCMCFFLPLSSYYPLMSSSYFKVSAFHGSVVELLYAGGMMGVSALIGLFGNIKRKFLMGYIGLLGMGITSFVCGILPGDDWAFWIFAIFCMLMGGCGNVFNIPIIAYMQETIPPEAMGRAFSLMGSVMSLAMPLGLLVSGPVAEKYGVEFWFLVTGVGVTVIAIAAMLLSAGLKEKKIS